MPIILHNFKLSSASYRVRIALALKGLSSETRDYVLRKGEHKAEDYLDINPQGLVPALEDDGHIVTQSLAIIEYLEERFPEPGLLPATTAERARVRALALSIACDIHPLNNLRVLEYLTGEMGLSEAQRDQWYHHWIRTEFTALEKNLATAPQTGQFCHYDTPGLADICLVPQVFNAKRFKCDLDPYPTIRRINENCLALDAFSQTAPDA